MSIDVKSAQPEMWIPENGTKGQDKATLLTLLGVQLVDYPKPGYVNARLPQGSRVVMNGHGWESPTTIVNDDGKPILKVHWGDSPSDGLTIVGPNCERVKPAI